MKKSAYSVVALLLASAAAAGEAVKKPDAKAATNAPPSFAVVCSNAWVKGVTEKSPVDYKPGEEIKFSISLMGVTNAIPKDTYFYQWKRTGDDGAVEEGRAPLTKEPFAYATKLEKPGFLRLSAQIVTADGKPFLKKTAKGDQPLRFEGGAGVALEDVAGRAEAKPRVLDAAIKELRRKVAAVPFKNIARTPVAAPALKGYTVSAVSVPCPGPRPLTGYLVLPDAAAKGEKMPCRLFFVACGFAKAQPLPSRWEVVPDCVSLLMPYDGAASARAAEGYYPDLCAQILRALQYLKTLPEWNGAGLVAHGSGFSSQLALMAGGLGEGVTKVVCYNVSVPEAATYDPLFFARRIPSSCLVDVVRVGLGDDLTKPIGAAQLWNTLSCEKKILWRQGGQTWSDQWWFSTRDVTWEKLSSVAYRGMESENSRSFGRQDNSFRDPDLALRDKIVVEAVIDPSQLKEVDPNVLSQMKSYAVKDRIPFTLYVSIPDKKVKDKVWDEFTRTMSAVNGAANYPVYLNASGMDLPKPEKLPWYNVADIHGVLRYSGPDIQKAYAAVRMAMKNLPEADPVFAYAPLKLFREEVSKPPAPRVKKRTGAKLYKYIEGEMRKCARTDPARHAEAEHLLHGMRQACDAQLDEITEEARDRPGRAWLRLGELIADWPELEADPRAVRLQNRVKRESDIEKIAKLETELVHLRDWKPEKSAEIKRRDAAVAAFRKKLEKFGASKNTALQGEALLIQTEFDNPPPAPAQN